MVYLIAVLAYVLGWAYGCKLLFEQIEDGADEMPRALRVRVEQSPIKSSVEVMIVMLVGWPFVLSAKAYALYKSWRRSSGDQVVIKWKDDKE